MRQALAATTVVTLLGLVPAGPAAAYYPHVGDRAADFYGRDIVGGGVVHLEDYLGQWVWVEFWSPG